MTETTTNTIEDLKKMSPAERTKLLKKIECEFANISLHLRMGKEKRSHVKADLKKQIARIHTLNHSA